MTVAAVILLQTVPTGPGKGRMDLAGRDCATVDEALAHLRDHLPMMEGAWEMALVVPGHTVAELAALDGPPSLGRPPVA